MPWIDLIRKLAVPAAIITLALTLWFSGDHHGQNVIQAKWDAQKQRDRVAVEAEHERVYRQEQDYAEQLARAKSESDHNRAELARLRALPRPRVLCYASDPAPTSLPGLPAPSVDHPSSGRVLPQAAGQDLTNDFYILADDADTAIEAARDALERWPK